MKNFVQPGETITLVAPYAVVSGAGLLVGSIFGVAANTAAISAPVETVLVGVFDLSKATALAWTQGVRLYWDDAAKNVTTAAAAGVNKLIGVAAQAQLAGDTVGRVLLTQSFTI